MNIAVGSRKPYKIRAATLACELVFAGGARIFDVDVSSGVSAQPMSNEESIEGAKNRAGAAIEQAPEHCELGIGIENGLVQVGERWFANTWIVALDSAGREGMASSLQRPVPAAVMELVEQGHELSQAVRDVFGNVSETSFDGLIGLMTQGALTRHDVLCDGIVAALSPIAHYQVFDN